MLPAWLPASNNWKKNKVIWIVNNFNLEINSFFSTLPQIQN